MTPLFVEMKRPRQAWELVGGALVAGGMCGVGLAFSPWLYVAGVVVSLVGGLGTAAQHRTARGALARAFVAGAAWALGVVGALALTGRPATIAMPESPLWFLPWGIVPSCVVTVSIWWGLRLSRRRRDARPSPLASESL